MGLEPEEILSTFYTISTLKREKDGWRMPFNAEALKGTKPTYDLINADTGKVVVEVGKKLTPRLISPVGRKGPQGDPRHQ